MNSNLDNTMKIGITYRSRLLNQHGDLLSEQTCKNIFTTQGMNYILDSALGDLNKLTAFYLGIFEGNYTPLITDTAATFPAAATETTAYTQANRVLFVKGGAVANGTISNVTAEAVFTFNASKRIYGAFTSSSQAKGSTLGVLVSAAKFPAYQDAVAGNLLYLQAGCQLVNV